MLTVLDYLKIRTARAQGGSIRSLAQRLGHAHQRHQQSREETFVPLMECDFGHIHVDYPSGREMVNRLSHLGYDEANAARIMRSIQNGEQLVGRRNAESPGDALQSWG